MRSAFRKVCLTLAPLIAPGLTCAAEVAKSADEKLRGLGLAASDVGTPGFGRVFLAFLLVAALAWAATWILRRYGVRFRSAVIGGVSPIRQLARNTLPGGIACHLVETEGRQVLITVTRNGVSSLLLGTPATAPPPPGPSPDSAS
jgi:hypothetical protein